MSVWHSWFPLLHVLSWFSCLGGCRWPSPFFCLRRACPLDSWHDCHRCHVVWLSSLVGWCQDPHVPDVFPNAFRVPCIGSRTNEIQYQSPMSFWMLKPPPPWVLRVLRLVGFLLLLFLVIVTGPPLSRRFSCSCLIVMGDVFRFHRLWSLPTPALVQVSWGHKVLFFNPLLPPLACHHHLQSRILLLNQVVSTDFLDRVSCASP